MKKNISMMVILFTSCPDSSEECMTNWDCIHPKSRAEGKHNETLQNLPALPATQILLGSFLVLPMFEYSHQVKGQRSGFWWGKAT